MIVDMDFIQSLGYGELYQNVLNTFSFLFHWFPLWGPFVLGYIFIHEWLHYVQARFISNIKWILLEIKLPKEIHKTPLAMELVFNALYQSTSPPQWWDKYWKGKVKDWFSLEMVSIDGHVKFFIRTSTVYKNIIEAQMYAQYPDVEMYEVPDYTRYVDYRGKEGAWDMLGTEYKLAKPDAYPIKTYVDYGMDKLDIKEETKTDPLTSIVEYLGSIGKDEQIWIQIIVQSASKNYKKKDGTKGDWTDEGRDLINKLAGRDKKGEDGKPAKFEAIKATKGEQDVISAIERNITKIGFDCGFRAIYLAKREKMNYAHIKALGGLMRPFGTNNLNGFKGHEQTYGWDFPWQDFNFIRLTRKKEKLFKAYKYRSWFHLPRKIPPFVLSSEELATIFHLPGGVAQTPTFGRIPSRKGEAPVNLPM
jgi:hypothetical protein